MADRFLLQPIEQGVLLLDFKAFWLDYSAQLMQQEWASETVKVKPLLIPERLGIPVETVAESYLEFWTKLGFDLNLTGPKSVALRKIPASLMHININ